MLIIRKTVVTLIEQPKRICKECGNHFIPVKQKQLFCAKKCYKKQWDRNNCFNRKPREYDEISHPNYACWNCGTSVHLEFDPRVDWKLWELFRCPKCGVDKYF